MVDADSIAKEVTGAGSPGEGIYKKLFGTVDRSIIRKKILESPDLKTRLEQELHPLIREKSYKKISEYAKNGSKAVIYDAALLIEAGRHKELDGVIVVTSPVEERISRLIARDGISRATALAMIGTQLSDADKIKDATWTLENNGSIDSLKKQVLLLVKSLQNQK